MDEGAEALMSERLDGNCTKDCWCGSNKTADEQSQEGDTP